MLISRFDCGRGMDDWGAPNINPQERLRERGQNHRALGQYYASAVASTELTPRDRKSSTYQQTAFDVLRVIRQTISADSGFPCPELTIQQSLSRDLQADSLTIAGIESGIEEALRLELNSLHIQILGFDQREAVPDTIGAIIDKAYQLRIAHE